LTHKRIICEKHFLEGKSVQQTARETYRSPQAVIRYANDCVLSVSVCGCNFFGLPPPGAIIGRVPPAHRLRRVDQPGRSAAAGSSREARARGA